MRCGPTLDTTIGFFMVNLGDEPLLSHLALHHLAPCRRASHHALTGQPFFYALVALEGARKAPWFFLRSGAADGHLGDVGAPAGARLPTPTGPRR